MSKPVVLCLNCRAPIVEWDDGPRLRNLDGSPHDPTCHVAARVLEDVAKFQRLRPQQRK